MSQIKIGPVQAFWDCDAYRPCLVISLPRSSVWLFCDRYRPLWMWLR